MSVFAHVGWERKWHWMFLFTISLQFSIGSIPGDHFAQRSKCSVMFYRGKNAHDSCWRSCIGVDMPSSFLLCSQIAFWGGIFRKFFILFYILTPVFLYSNIVAAWDIQLQRTLLINRIYTFKSKESLFFLCSCLSYFRCELCGSSGQRCFPHEAI